MIYYTPGYEKLIGWVLTPCTNWTEDNEEWSCSLNMVSMTRKEADDFYEGRRTLIPKHIGIGLDTCLKGICFPIYEKYPVSAITGLIFASMDLCTYFFLSDLS